MRRRHQDEYETLRMQSHPSTTSQSSYRPSSFQSYQTKCVSFCKDRPLFTNDIENDEYFRFKDMQRRRQQDQLLLPLYSFNRNPDYSNEKSKSKQGEFPLHLPISRSLIDNPQNITMLQEESSNQAKRKKRNLQQQARRLILSSDEKNYITAYNKAYIANKRAKLRAYNELQTSNENKRIINNQSNHDRPPIPSHTVSFEDGSIHQGEISTLHSLQQKRNHKQLRLSMTEEEKKEMRRNQQKQYRQRKKAELQTLEDSKVQGRSELNKDQQNFINETFNWDPKVVLAEEQKYIQRLRQEAQQIKKERQQADKRIYEDARQKKSERKLQAKAYLEEQEQGRIRAYHDIIKSFSPTSAENSPILSWKTPEQYKTTKVKNLKHRSPKEQENNIGCKLKSKYELAMSIIEPNSAVDLEDLMSTKPAPHDKSKVNRKNLHDDIKKESILLEDDAKSNNKEIIDLSFDDSLPAAPTQCLESIHYNSFNIDEVLISNSYAEITRRTISILDGQEWLNDQIINFYMHMLLHRDRTLSMETRQSWFGTTFFFAKLLENGEYNYNAVRRWTSRNIDIYLADKVLIPINVNNIHWTLLVFYMMSKELHYYDSQNGDGCKYLQYGLRWLSDEYMDKKQTVLNFNEWRCFHKESGVPQQTNGYDCGVFVLMFAIAIAYNQPLTSFSQEDMPRYRFMIKQHILRGSLLDLQNNFVPYMNDLPIGDLLSREPYRFSGHKHRPTNYTANRCSSHTELQNQRPTIKSNSDNKLDESDSEYDEEYDHNHPLPVVNDTNSIDSDDTDNQIDINRSIGCITDVPNETPPTLLSSYQINENTISKADNRYKIRNLRKGEETSYASEFDDTAVDNLSDSCESESKLYCIEDTRSINQKQLKNTSAHKTSYWKKRKEKQISSINYKKGLLGFNDANLHEFYDGESFRHR